MNSIPPLPLAGCATEPLGNYLKALGVFRLVGEQLDPGARAWWRNGVFYLQFSTGANYECNGKEHPCPGDEIARQDWLVRWFLHRCEYSPFPAPWLTGTGYLPLGKRSAGADALAAILNSRTRTLRRYRRAFWESARAAGIMLSGRPERWIDEVTGVARNEVVQSLGKDSTSKGAEALLVRRLRNITRDMDTIRWLDALGTVKIDRHTRGLVREWFPILAGGGGEASGKYVTNLQQYLLDCLATSADKSRSVSRLRGSLFAAAGIGATEKDAMGAMYFPGLIEAPNVGQSPAVSRRVNPWDFILLMEGTLLWATALTRQKSTNTPRASFPYYCSGSFGGALLGLNEVPGAEDSISQGEIWCPLWEASTTLAELLPIFAEGRLQIGSRTAVRAVEFVRAIARLGLEGGIAAFIRYGLLRRSGSGRQTTLLAVPLGTYVPYLNRDIFLLNELDDYLIGTAEKVQVHDNQPQRIVFARKTLEDDLFIAASQTAHGVRSHDEVFNVLVAAAALECECGVTAGKIKRKEGKTTRSVEAPTIPPLGSDWLWIGPREHRQLFDDGAPEFRLARAIGSIHTWGKPAEDQPHAVGPIRENLHPLRIRRERSGKWVWQWWPESRRAVWQRGRPILDNLAAVLERRLIDSQKGAGESLPLSSAFEAPYSEVLQLWNGEVDEDRLGKLIHAVALIDHGPRPEEKIAKREARDPTPDLSGGGVWFHGDEARTNWGLPSWLSEPEYKAALALPRLYLLLKLCFLGGRLPAAPLDRRTAVRSGAEPYPPGNLQLLRLLLAGRASEAGTLAARLLRAKGYAATIESKPGLPIEAYDSAAECRRIAGLLLIPINHPSVLAALTIKPQTNA